MTERINDIDREAAEWAARSENVVSEEETRALEVWLDKDPRHLGAYLKAKAVLLHVERHADALRADKVVAFRPRFSPQRRIVLAGGLAASIAAVFFALNSGQRIESATYATAIGESKVVTLADGSAVTMNTNSRLAVRYSRSERSIALEKGEALFDVAKDKARPFIVSTGGVNVRAVGTSFAVRSVSNAQTEVLVVEGVVRIANQSAELVNALRANSQAVITGATQVAVTAVSPQEMSRNLAWRSGRIVFRRQTLASAAKEFARYSKTAITFEDSAIANLTVTGAYLANDPVGFAKAVALAFDLDAVVGDKNVRLVHRKH